MLSRIENTSVMTGQKNTMINGGRHQQSSLSYIPIKVATTAGKYKGYMRKIKTQSSKNS